MEYFIIRRRILTGLVLLGLLETVLVFAYLSLSESLLPGEDGDGKHTFVKMGMWFNGAAFVGLFLAYQFAYRFLGISRAAWVNGREMTAMDGDKRTVSPEGMLKTWFAGSASLLGLLAVVVGLGAAFFIHNARNPSVFGIVGHGTVEQLDAALAGHPDAIGERAKDGMTLLMGAVQGGRSDMVAALLAHGAAVNATDSAGRTPLMLAIGRADLVERLLLHGADASASDRRGMSPLHWSVQHRSTACARLLLQYGGRVDARNKDADTPLLIAVRSGFGEGTGLLLLYGANSNLADQIGQTALHYATANDDVPTVEALLEAGAEPTTLSMQGWSPLHMAAMNGSVPVVELLLRHEVPVDIENKRSQTPLTTSVMKNQTKVVECLLEHGADVDRKDMRGNTYLHLALENGHFDVATVLIAAEAGLDIANNAGITPRNMMKNRGLDALPGLHEAAVSR